MFRSPIRLLNLLLAPVFLLFACSEDAIPEELPDYEVGDIEPIDFDGYFVSKIVFAQCVEDPFGGGMTFQNIVSYSVNDVEVDEENGGVWIKSHLCHAEMTEVFGTAMELSTGFMQSVSQEGPYLFKLSSQDVGARVSLEEQVELRGVVLDDKRDPLPTTIDDPRIFDYDGNGNPGFTIALDGAVDGDLWTVERMFMAIEGQVYTQDLIAGDVYGHLEDSFVYSSKRVIPTDSIIIPITDPGTNFFEMRRVDHDINCTQLISDYDVYFEAPPEGESRAAQDYCEGL